MNWWETIDLYEKKIKTSTIEIGDIVWCPVIYNDKNTPRKILEIERATVDNDTHNRGNFCIADYDRAKHYIPTADALPVKKLDLRIGEELALFKSKMRPCVVLHLDTENVQPSGNGDTGVNHLNQKSAILLPIFGFFNDAKQEQKFLEKTENNMKQLGHKKILFFPKDPEAANDSIITKDSFGRFDMIFQVPSSFIRCTKSKMASEFLMLMNFYFQNYLEFQIDEMYFEPILMILEEAHKSLIP